MSRRVFKWTEKQIDKLNKVRAVLEEFADYKPLTLRQVYYQLVSKEFIANTKSQYTMLSGLIKWARIDGYIPWEDIEDRIRVFRNGAGWVDKDDFVECEMESFLSGYRRDFLQSQEKHIEVWIEKDALSSIFTRASLPYCVSVVVCRGFTSVSFLHDFKERLESHADKEPLMLYFGDFDPSGMEMLESMEITLRDELEVTGIEFKRIALLEDDIDKYNLPHNPGALKETDTRAKKHLESYGRKAVELDALPPDILQEKIRGAIENELDIKAFDRERDTYRSELDELRETKDKVTETLDLS